MIDEELKNLINDIKTTLISLVDEERAVFSKNYYPTNQSILGVKNPDLNLLVKELKSSTKSYKPQDLIQLAQQLVDEKIMECQQIAYGLVRKNNAVFKVITEQQVKQLQGVQDNWVSTDTYGIMVVGYAWIKKVIDDEYIKYLVYDKDPWQRRIALVATVALNQPSNGGNGDVQRTIEICNLLKSDKNKMVQKALSWSLRSAIKYDKNSVSDFVKKHQSILPKFVVREIETKLITGKKKIT